ncbi:hypothetical protein O181_013396 [Austropuccinia psidii MF-1]|uniref:Retrotransposon gag domain-containing protein n=1 Tax=Austropuccinia psidii MF-1 TaxID=1389203 RepID=A0A9Q3GN65_9BASI|nr:hypothetical protein [Austropuccinia psidii MF-1]
MPFKHSCPARQTRAQAGLTPAPRGPLDGTPAVPQERTNHGRGRAIQEGRKRAYDEEEEENSLEEEESDGTEGVPAPVGEYQDTGGPSIAQSNQPFSNQSEPPLLTIMHQMTQSMANLQDASSSEGSRPPAFKTTSMKIETYICNLTNQDPAYLLNNWALFKSQLFTLFGDPKEARKAEAELDGLIMKEGGHVSLYIAYFRSLVSRIGDWGERALVHHFRKGLDSRILDQLATHPSRIDSLQDLMDVTLELDTRYHERERRRIIIKKRRMKPQSQALPL